VDRDAVTLAAGGKSRQKTVAIEGLSCARVHQLLLLGAS
jgi:uncharacterized protein YggU (UPF0235/DUF167 family)